MLFFLTRKMEKEKILHDTSLTTSAQYSSDKLDRQKRSSARKADGDHSFRDTGEIARLSCCSSVGLLKWPRNAIDMSRKIMLRLNQSGVIHCEPRWHKIPLPILILYPILSLKIVEWSFDVHSAFPFPRNQFHGKIGHRTNLSKG